jgi:phospholipid/cholesterol/gamma-HCH transport system substrate-binding protein
MPRTRSIAWAELKLGILGVVAIAATSVLIFAVGGQGGFFWQRYPLLARFDDINGLKTGAIVRLNGMEVGKVTGIEFAGTQIEVSLQVSRSVRDLITSESQASVGSLSLLGEPIVDIRAAQTGTPLPDGAYLRTVTAGGIAGAADVASSSLAEAGELLAGIRAGRGTLGRLAADDTLYIELEELLRTAGSLSRQIETGQGTLGALVNDSAAYQALLASLDNLRAITARIGAGQGPLGRLVNDESLSSSLARSSGNLERITAKLAHGDGTAGQLLTDRELYDRLNRTADRMDRLAAELEAGRGTAGQLLHDPALYDNLDLAVTELRDLVADIRANPAKYLHVRISIF